MRRAVVLPQPEGPSSTRSSPSATSSDRRSTATCRRTAWSPRRSRLGPWCLPPLPCVLAEIQPVGIRQPMDSAISLQVGQSGYRLGSRPGTHSLPQSARTAVRLTMPSTTLGPTETKSPPWGYSPRARCGPCARGPGRRDPARAAPEPRWSRPLPLAWSRSCSPPFPRGSLHRPSSVGMRGASLLDPETASAASALPAGEVPRAGSDPRRGLCPAPDGSAEATGGAQVQRGRTRGEWQVQRMCISPNLPVAFDRILFRVVAELPYTQTMLISKSVRDVGLIRPDSGTSGSGCAGAWVERDRSEGTRRAACGSPSSRHRCLHGAGGDLNVITGTFLSSFER